MMSYNTIRQLTPYLISPKCAHAFGLWIKDCQILNVEITKERIIHHITDLEVLLEYRNTHPRPLPGFLVSTTLNLPPGEADVTLNVHLATPSPLPTKDGKSGTPQSPKTDRKNTTRSHLRGRDDKRAPAWRMSKSPDNRPRQTSRGRSPGGTQKPEKKPDNAGNSRSNSWCAEIDAVQYYSIHSQSPNRSKFSVPSVFSRPLTPRSLNQMKGNYFLYTTGTKYKDVCTSGRCLRCYSNRHRAAQCPTFHTPHPHTV